MLFLLMAALVLHIPAHSDSVTNAFRLKAEGTKRLREESVQSAALGRQMKYRVLVPQGYDASLRRYPVLYLLHGLTGDYKDWTMRTNVSDYSQALPLIIVMPDGENSWYTNAADGSAQFEDYVATVSWSRVSGLSKGIGSVASSDRRTARRERRTMCSRWQPRCVRRALLISMSTAARPTRSLPRTAR